jgi:hypothetical protein
MTENLDPASVAEPAPRRRRWWPSVLLAVLSLLLLLVGLAAGKGHENCCAIDCSAYPEVCEQRTREHHEYEQKAGITAFGAFVGSVAAMGYAIVRLGRW